MITPPERTPEQQRTHERVQALRVGTPAAVRDWATRYDVPLIGIDDDELLLISIHEARAELFRGSLQRASLWWLKAHKARIVAEREIVL